ncbi:hypothetical protein L1987_48973 [Smallanthus sonchifolius]|uniref:Uncharacterized protein n=1 Tax=Smallanthus sonchifolius TaxID=185202 RepID=A0ACB9FU11_9ASTR|nr:hypothetical protein L1987_48973 [Smallanthus sonchifolius]
MNQSYPTAYTMDVKEMEDNMGKITASGESVKEEDLEVMKKLWERVFDQPYEKAGCPAIDDVKPLIHWEVKDTDVNVKYRPLLPRFLLERIIIASRAHFLKSATSHHPTIQFPTKQTPSHATHITS